MPSVRLDNPPERAVAVTDRRGPVRGSMIRAADTALGRVLGKFIFVDDPVRKRHAGHLASVQFNPGSVKSPEGHKPVRPGSRVRVNHPRGNIQIRQEPRKSERCSGGNGRADRRKVLGLDLEIPDPGSPNTRLLLPERLFKSFQAHVGNILEINASFLPHAGAFLHKFESDLAFQSGFARHGEPESPVFRHQVFHAERI
ncbi:MAG: hypothetical protein BWY42_01508 [Candidatus Omnitrophica bacterium ADurb.Bin277]|nr:MAG: hypothetical protein BWY42_01508 [Candidatus Omnitrophica bacterium ADurb.Bin277]